ncbi:MAG: ExbD/TolR family protein [Gammaproteobacteria bacterium]
MNLRTKARDEPEVNLTSLIDVVLLLLVFFMITTSFVRESKIGIRLPKASKPAIVGVVEEQLIITISAQGTYLVGGKPLLDNRPATLEAAINKLAADSSGQRITISADANASHQAVVTAMDMAGKAGFVEINISTLSTGQESN